MSALRIAIPGQPVRVIPDADPYASLTPRQAEVLQAVRSTNGNRSRAARLLGLPVHAVQDSLRIAQRKGARVPPAPLSRRGCVDLGPRQRRVA